MSATITKVNKRTIMVKVLFNYKTPKGTIEAAESLVKIPTASLYVNGLTAEQAALNHVATMVYNFAGFRG